MKKLLLMSLILLLSACATLTPEEIALHQNKTIAQINKEIQDKNIAGGKLVFPETCELVMKQRDKEGSEREKVFGKLGKDYNTQLERVNKVGEGKSDCEFCKMKEFGELKATIKNLISLYTTKTSFGVILKDRDEESVKYIKRVFDLCGDIAPIDEFARFDEAYSSDMELILACNPFDPEIIKKEKAKFENEYRKEKEQSLKELATECLQEHRKATSAKCNCYANEVWESARKLIPKLLEMREKCVSQAEIKVSLEYSVSTIKRDAEIKCGLLET